MATKDDFIEGQEQGKEWERRTTKAKGQRRATEAERKPLASHTITFLLLSSPPSSQYPTDEDLYVKTSD